MNRNIFFLAEPGLKSDLSGRAGPGFYLKILILQVSTYRTGMLFMTLKIEIFSTQSSPPPHPHPGYENPGYVTGLRNYYPF